MKRTSDAIFNFIPSGQESERQSRRYNDCRTMVEIGAVNLQQRLTWREQTITKYFITDLMLASVVDRHRLREYVGQHQCKWEEAQLRVQLSWD